MPRCRSSRPHQRAPGTRKIPAARWNSLGGECLFVHLVHPVLVKRGREKADSYSEAPCARLSIRRRSSTLCYEPGTATHRNPHRPSPIMRKKLKTLGFILTRTAPVQTSSAPRRAVACGPPIGPASASPRSNPPRRAARRRCARGRGSGGTLGPRPDDGGRHPAERAQTAVHLADVVEQPAAISSRVAVSTMARNRRATSIEWRRSCADIRCQSASRQAATATGPTPRGAARVGGATASRRSGGRGGQRSRRPRARGCAAR